MIALHLPQKRHTTMKLCRRAHSSHCDLIGRGLAFITDCFHISTASRIHTAPLSRCNWLRAKSHGTS